MSGETGPRNFASLSIPGMLVGTVENCGEPDEEEPVDEAVEDDDAVEKPFSEALNKTGFPTKAMAIRNTTTKTDICVKTLKRFNTIMARLFKC
jgi:hypothetical protein